MSSTTETQPETPEETVVSQTTRSIGMVKWFNKKQGYGFIHVLSEGVYKDTDIFVHYSAIRTKDTTEYKYLVQGEYVECLVEKSNKDTHEYQAVDITGMMEGLTLCDTRQAILKEQEHAIHSPHPPRRRHSEDEPTSHFHHPREPRPFRPQPTPQRRLAASQPPR